MLTIHRVKKKTDDELRASSDPLDQFALAYREGRYREASEHVARWYQAYVDAPEANFALVEAARGFTESQIALCAMGEAAHQALIRLSRVGDIHPAISRSFGPTKKRALKLANRILRDLERLG